MSHKQPTILVADNNKLFVELLVKELNNSLPSFNTIGFHCSTVLIKQINKLNPTLVIYNIEMMSKKQGSIIKFIHKKHKGLKSITLGTNSNDLYNEISKYFEANSYISKEVGIESFIDCVRIVLKTNLYVSNHTYITSSLFTHNLLIYIIKTLDLLTKREKEVLDYSLKGFNNREISEKMFITQKSVENYINKISNKFNIKSQRESYRNWVYNNSEVIKLFVP